MTTAELSQDRSGEDDDDDTARGRLRSGARSAIDQDNQPLQRPGQCLGLDSSTSARPDAHGVLRDNS